MGFSRQEYWSGVPSPSLVHIPEDIKITLKGCPVVAKGSGGTLGKDSNLINVQLTLLGKKKKKFQVTKGGEIERHWLVCINCSHVQNTSAAACFAIVILQENGSPDEAQNFFGKKQRIYCAWMKPGVVCLLSQAPKDEFIFFF